ncbi:MAG: DUF86 domain-containing protein [Defluviitaleaceae bacterium]|nr:DUF86 domain-containing protein [Defluviitaleaceae bacterium]MCL2238672.1 DUF86 domain-containing protein [Defluviitaleaceae bacterium]
MVERGRRNDVITKKILKEINDIARYTSGMSANDFYADDKTQKAVAMTLINIGELSKSFSSEFIEGNKNIPWKDIQATRNIAAHNYESFDMQIVWKTIKDDLPALKKTLEAFR